MTLTIYHAPMTRSVRVIWLCEELGVPYETKVFPVRGEYMASDDFGAVNPNRRVPAIKDDGLILFESIAIVEYLLAKYGPTSLAPDPSDLKDYGPYLQWLHYGEAGMGPYVTMLLGHTAILPEAARIPAMAAWGRREALACLNVLAGPLAAHDYLLPGGFSAADVSVAYMLFLAKLAGMSGDFPEPVRAYFARCAERPGWRVASARPR